MKYFGELALWVKGCDLDWSIFYSANRQKRISLPSYPFAKERYWYSKTESVKPVDAKSRSGSKSDLIGNLDAIEDVLNKIENDSMEKDDALSLLRELGVN
jgi:acyl transferase domain-containing protein